MHTTYVNILLKLIIILPMLSFTMKRPVDFLYTGAFIGIDLRMLRMCVYINIE